jgi:hypothetical protein
VRTVRCLIVVASIEVGASAKRDDNDLRRSYTWLIHDDFCDSVLRTQRV